MVAARAVHSVDYLEKNLVVLKVLQLVVRKVAVWVK